MKFIEIQGELIALENITAIKIINQTVWKEIIISSVDGKKRKFGFESDIKLNSVVKRLRNNIEMVII